MRTKSISAQYLAGFIDGEGCIGIHKTGASRYTVRIFISNTNLDVLRKIQSSWGGGLYINSRKKENWKIGYKLVWNSFNCKPILKSVYRHLIIKKRHAEIALSALDTFTSGGRAVPENLILQRTSLALQMRNLNRKGPAVEAIA